MDPVKSDNWLGFLEALKPPPGYVLDAGIGTTYGLSFEVLTAVLLAFVNADMEGTTPDIGATLHAINRLHVLVHRGSIHLDAERTPPRLFALYDRIVQDVHLPDASFHPKLWALRFARRDRPELRASPPFIYRILCGSRNLSVSQNWDVGARFDGVEVTSRKEVSPIASSTAKFLRQLGPDTTQVHGLSWILTRPLYTLATALGVLFGGLAGLAVAGPWGDAGGVLALIGALLFVVPTRIRVSPDGISFRWLWITRHVALAEIADIAVYDDTQWLRFREIGLRIVLRDRVDHVPMRYHDRLAFWVRQPAQDAEMLVACVLSQMGERRALPASPDPPSDGSP